MLRAYRLDNGNLMVPLRAESEDGVLGDGMVEINADDELARRWVKWYADNRQEVPGEPKK